MTTPLEILDQIEISMSDLNDRIDWIELFGNMNPVEIEIGCGKGRFIINSAMKYPDIRPTTAPTPVPITTARKPTFRDTLAPSIILENTSLPYWSVPSQYAALGGSLTFS